MEPSKEYHLTAFFSREKDERYLLDMDDFGESPEWEEWYADPDNNQKTLDEAADCYAVKRAVEILAETGGPLVLILRDAFTQDTIWVDYYGRTIPNLFMQKDQRT